MDLVTVRELYKNREAYLDKEVSIGGWVRSVRASKAFGFIVVSDGTYFETLQVVYHDNMANFAARDTCIQTTSGSHPFFRNHSIAWDRLSSAITLITS